MDDLAAQIIRQLHRNPKLRLKEVILQGSRKHASSVDPWSDVDIKVILPDDRIIDAAFMEYLSNSLGLLIGRELLLQDQSILCRMVVQLQPDGTVKMIDCLICKESSLGVPVLLDDGLRALVSEEDQFWFKLFLSAKKFMRDDYLIGTHLLLGRMQDLLVIQMRQRDAQKGTSIHRFGAQEPVHQLLKLDQLALLSKSQIKAYLLIIAQQFDHSMVALKDTYLPKRRHLAAYLGKANTIL